MQVVPQHTQASIPTGAYVVDPPSASRRQYSQQSPQSAQSGDLDRFQSSTRTTNSPQSSRQPSKRPSGNATQPNNPDTSQQAHYQTSGGSFPSNSSTPRIQDMSATTRASPIVAKSSASPSYQQTRRDQRLQQELPGGPPIPPPPRTSSNQKTPATNLPSGVSLTDRTAASRSGSKTADESSSSSRAATARETRQERSRGTTFREDQFSRAEQEHEKDAASTAAAIAQSRRKGPTSPDGPPQRTASTREPPARLSPAAMPGRSTSQVGVATPPAQGGKEDNQIIKRVVVTDPEIDLEREQERQAEATPVLSLVGSGGVDDAARASHARGSARSRQDYSASRRKETKFGDYVLGQTLGEGEFGKVKLGWKKDGSVQVAIKLIRRESLGTNPSRLPKIYREISILRELSHPNIVRLHEMAETDRYIGIILEYASGGELFDFILNHRYLKDNAARRLFAQLVSGVGYLHKKGIVHRDLKLENLLLDRNRNIIITDFGFANTFDPRDELSDEIEYNLTDREFVKRRDLERVQENGSRKGDLMQTSCGSPCYAAPELVVTDSLYTGRKVDVWSCGVILYAMLAGYLPFDDDPANPEGDNINLLYKYIVSTPLTFPEYVTPHARDLLRRILVPDPRKRADLFEVARHSWLSDYAHVVSHVTSSTTTVGEIANTTVTSDQQDAPLLARSASVREPSKAHAPNLSPVVGGLSHQGKIDPEQSAEKPKQPRDPKRRTVQVEYVAPQSQTARGDTTPSVQSPVTIESPSAVGINFSKTRARAGTEALENIPRQVSTVNTGAKPLPREPNVIQTSGSSRYQYQPSSSRTHQGSNGSRQAMAPPPRPPKDMPRSASDSANAFGYTNTSAIARPNTSGSMASSGAGRLPSRGNSYSQPLAPTLAATNAQGRLAQPKNGKQYNISAPIPQAEPYLMEQSIGRPSTHQNSQAPFISSQREQARGHKRSNTLGTVIARSGSLFGRSRPQPPPVPQSESLEKRYPPTSMKTPITSDSPPRQSLESRRSISFGFGRKNSNLQKNSDPLKQEKPRRFSLLPASFSFKALTGASKDQQADNILPVTERRPSVTAQPTPPSRGQPRPHTAVTGRGQTQSNTYQRDDAASASYDGQRERSRDATTQQARRNVAEHRTAPQTQQSQSGSSQYQSQLGSAGPPRRLQGQSYLLEQSGTPTDSEVSLGPGQHRPVYPPGFDSYEDETQVSAQHSRSPRVLQKNNRRFADAYEQEQEPGYGTGGHHAGSSGAAKRVMDFFRRRGKARAGDDRG